MLVAGLVVPVAVAATEVVTTVETVTPATAITVISFRKCSPCVALRVRCVSGNCINKLERARAVDMPRFTVVRVPPYRLFIGENMT